MRVLTVTDDDSVDEQGQEGVLVGGSDVLEQSLGVVVADGRGGRAAGGAGGGGGGSRDGELVETHLDGCVWCVMLTQRVLVY